jgi:hypothetical protein
MYVCLYCAAHNPFTVEKRQPALPRGHERIHSYIHTDAFVSYIHPNVANTAAYTHTYIHTYAFVRSIHLNVANQYIHAYMILCTHTNIIHIHTYTHKYRYCAHNTLPKPMCTHTSILKSSYSYTCIIIFSYTHFTALHPRMCTSSLSCPENVRPHPVHATITCSSYVFCRIALRSSRLCTSMHVHIYVCMYAETYETFDAIGWTQTLTKHLR